MTYRGVGECGMCGTVQKLVTSQQALCSACWKFRHGRGEIMAWHMPSLWCTAGAVPHA